MISSPKEITKEWLEDILQTKIVNATAIQNPAFNSSVTHINLKYSEDVELPNKILVKHNKEHNGKNEIQFYRLAESMNLPISPPCLGMGYDPKNGHSYLVLKDLSETHRPPVARNQLIALNGVPDISYLESIVDCIAKFHAAFWEHPQFGTIPVTTEMRSWYRDDDSHAKYVERRNLEWREFTKRYKDKISPDWLTLVEFSLGMLPKLFQSHIKPRLRSKQALTMSQGDCYLTQFLVPFSGSGKSYLVDFQDASVNFPAYDLVYMFATFWTRKQRSSYENSLLRRYQKELTRQGIKYDWDMLENDYRLSLIYMLFDPVWNATTGSSRKYWKTKMKCLVEAYQDWKCAQYLAE